MCKSHLLPQTIYISVHFCSRNIWSGAESKTISYIRKWRSQWGHMWWAICFTAMDNAWSNAVICDNTLDKGPKWTVQISCQYFVWSWSKSIGSPSSELVTPWKRIVCLLGWFRWGGVFLWFLLSKHQVDMSNDKPLLFVVSSVHNVLISHWDVNLLIGWLIGL